MSGTLTSPIWLKICMVDGNDLKLSHAKYFLTFISKKIEKNSQNVEFLKHHEKCIFQFVDPPDGHIKHVRNIILSYILKNFAGIGNFRISQTMRVLGPAKGLAHSRSSNYSPRT